MVTYSLLKPNMTLHNTILIPMVENQIANKIAINLIILIYTQNKFIHLKCYAMVCTVGMCARYPADLCMNAT